MNCPRCQAENRDGLRFCEDCGARLAAACPSCGAEITPGKRFCGSCGAALPGAAQPEARFSSPQAYTPKHLAERIINSKAALEGERKQVTVLFADLKGSMELLAGRDPENARKLLDPVIEHMMDAVHRYEGTVNQVMGDGIMALFGAPLAHEDDALRACCAALSMQDAVKRYAEEVRRREGVPVNIRVGLNSGEVVVRAIGSDLHMDYTAVGQTTHLAARMEQMAQPGSILLTGEVLRLAEGFVQVKPLGPVPVKGLGAAIEVYEVTGAGLVRRRMEAAVARGLTRFVGRNAELDHLHEALARSGARRGQVVAVVGEAGVGKSRLLYEFTRSHRMHGWLILESGSVSYGKATTYLPIIDLLRAYFQIETRDDVRKIRERITGKLITLDRALEPLLPAFLSLLDAPVEDPYWQDLDPPQRRQRTLDAIKRLLLRESQVQPLCLVFEDLHWIDSETQVVLDNLIENLPSARLLLLVNYRPEYQHGWGSKTYYTRLRIDPLPPDSAEELLHALVGEGAGLQPLKQLLIEHTEGNPFFLEESVRALVETHVLVGERGAYRLAKSVQAVQVPATVQAVLAARIDRLSPEDKRLLQSASVIGEDVPFALLQAIAEMPEETLRRSLTSLQAAEFLYETNLFPDLEYSFKHGLTYQVAYNSLLAERRRTLHARIVDTLERLHQGRLAEHVERLAHHSVRAEVWGKALSYLRQAGAKAFARSAHREAVAYFEQALTALRQLGEKRDTLEQAIDLRFDLRTSLIALGEIGRVLDCLHEAEQLATTLQDDRRLAWVFAFKTHYFWATGDHDQAVAAGQRALALSAAVGDSASTGAANLYLGAACQARGDYREAVELLRKNVMAVEAGLVSERYGGSGLLSVMSRTWLVFSLAEIGEFAEGLVCGEEGVRVAEAVDHPFSVITAYFGIGGLYLRRGDVHQAIAVLERGLARCQVANIPVLFPRVASLLGYAYALGGRVAEAVPILVRAVEQATSMRLMFGHSLWVGWLGEAYLLADRREDALICAQRAFDLCHDHQERGNQAWVLRLLGEVVSHRDPLDAEKAKACYRQARTLADELGMRPLVAHCHLGLGKLGMRTDQRDHARDHLTIATTMYREMGMTYWLEKVQKEVETDGRA